MAKFVKGSYRTISEVYTVLENLRQEGYTESDITLITNEDQLYKELANSTDAQVKLEESPKESHSLWERIMEAFPIFSSTDYMNESKNMALAPEEDTLLEGYQKELDDGDVIVIVDDVLNKEASLNLDQVDNTTPSSTATFESKKILEDTPERDSHPDVESMKDVLDQETTYVPGDEDTKNEEYPRD